MTNRATDMRQNLQEAQFARRDSLPLQVEVLRLEDLLRAPFDAKTTAQTRTQFHSILLIERGQSYHHVDFERHPIGPGDLLLMPAGCVQAFDRAGHVSGSLLLFTPEFLDTACARLPSLVAASDVLLGAGLRFGLGASSFAQARDDLATLSRYTESMRSTHFAEESIASAFSLLIFSLAGLAEISHSLDEQAGHGELVSRFQELLEAQFTRRHRAAWYAKSLNVSLRTLDRHLVASGGVSARQSISARLVLEAKRALIEQNIPIKNIAYELGFSEPQNFTRFFRTQTGLSPADFRTSQR